MSRSVDNPLLTCDPDEALAVLESLAGAAYLAEVEGTTFRCVAQNTRAARYTGVSHAEAVGRTYGEINGAAVAATFEPRWRRCVADGAIVQYEGHWEPPGGPRWGRVTLTPIVDDTGAVRRLLGLVVDITDQVEERRRRDEAMTRVIEDFVPICMHCKAIREGERWTAIEAFVERGSGAELSHSLCPDCARRHFPGYAD